MIDMKGNLKKKSKRVEPFEHMQTTRFGNQPAHQRTFEVLFHHLFVCFFRTSAKQQLRSETSGTSAGT